LNVSEILQAAADEAVNAAEQARIGEIAANSSRSG